MNRYRFLCFLILLLLLGGCRSRRSLPVQPDLIQTEQPLIESASLIDQELLEIANIQTSCDASPNASLACDLSSTPQIEVEINAAEYARWSINWQDVNLSTPQLHGDETLAFRMKRSEAITPNFYLVEREGQRIRINQRSYSLVEGWQDLHFPLREVRNEEGDWPNFNDIVEIQVVFEWADIVGEMAIESVRFDSVWKESVAISVQTEEIATKLEVPPNFQIEPIAEQLQGITQINFNPDGSMLVSLQDGRVWRYQQDVSDGITYDSRILYATGFSEVVGLLHDPSDESVWIGGRGQLYKTDDEDGNGVADLRELRIDGLPWGRHQNNGLIWNPVDDPFTGEPPYTWIYFGLGSTGDLDTEGMLNGSVLRFPRDGQGQADLELVSQGNRNAYALSWASVPLDSSEDEANWSLFASENGPDFNNAPDEVNHIRWQHHYGFPEQFGPVDPGQIDGVPYSGPLYPVTAHASASGLAYVSNEMWPIEYQTLYVSLFGQIFDEAIVGHRVDRITLVPIEIERGITYRGESSPFITGLDRPLPMTVDLDGNLVVGDYATGVVYRLRYVAQE